MNLLLSNVAAVAALAFVAVSVIGVLITLVASLFGVTIDPQAASLLDKILTASLGIVGGVATGAMYVAARMR